MRYNFRNSFSGTSALIVICFACLSLTDIAAGQNKSQSEQLLEKKQKEFLSWKFGMFLHFNMSTFAGYDWANGHEDSTIFNPEKLDCGQWADAAKAAGMKYAVLTVKHTGGYCLWDSKYTTHDIASFAWLNGGKEDIVKDFLDAFRSRGLKVGLYYCLPGDYANRFGNKLECGKEDLHGLPREATGDYEWFIERQVEELLTNYGPIDLLWFDQYSNPYTGKYWLQLKSLANRIQPECIVIANNSHNFEETDILGYEYPYLKSAKPDQALPGTDNKYASEVCDCLDDRGWFWETGGEKVQPVADLVRMVKLCNDRNANYLLDVPPNKDGLIPDLYVNQLKQVGEKLKQD